MAIRYRLGNDLDLDRVIALYHDSSLGERRPVDDRDCMQQMLDNANLVVTAWSNDDPTAELVGIARTITDFSYCAYLSDLAVHPDLQHRGIGKELIRRTQQELGPRAMLILLSAPAAADYYPKIGFQRHDSAWVLTREQGLT